MSEEDVKRQNMNSTEKGNRLEDKLYDYLLDQLNSAEPVFGVHPPSLCEVKKKEKYYCKESGRDVEFDVVVEIRREGRTEPHQYLVFECKNHQRPIEEIYVREFSSKIRSVFGQAVKGVMVASSRFQSGAAKLATNRRLGIVKFEDTGIEIIADRAIGAWAEKNFIQNQIFVENRRSKSLKFSAYIDGRYFCSFIDILHSIERTSEVSLAQLSDRPSNAIPFVSESEIQSAAQNAIALVGHGGEEVDVETICRLLDLNLSYSEEAPQDEDGNIILGSADFSRRLIEVNRHGCVFHAHVAIDSMNIWPRIPR